MPFTPETASKAGSLSSRKGKPNNLTRESREVISLLIKKSFPKFKKELKKLDGKDYCEVILKLMEYHVPKLNRTEIKGGMGEFRPVIVNLTREERDARINELIQKHYAGQNNGNTGGNG